MSRSKQDLYYLTKKELCELSLKTRANIIAKKYKTTESDVYEIYKEQKIQSMLMLSNKLILERYFANKKDVGLTCLETGVKYQKLVSVLNSNSKTTRNGKENRNGNFYSCTFEKANDICKSLGYKNSLDYISQNGSLKFKQQITPQL